MHFLSWLIGGIISGAVGVAAWLGIEFATQGEFSWIAWPVGLLVGWGVHRAAKADVRGGFLRGAVAAVLALLAIVGAKYTKVAVLHSQGGVAQKGVAPSTPASDNEEGPIITPSSGAVLEVPSTDESTASIILQGTKVGQPANGFGEMEMVWICLAALTAYVVGKGPGPSTLPAGEATAEQETPDNSDKEEPESE